MKKAFILIFSLIILSHTISYGQNILDSIKVTFGGKFNDSLTKEQIIEADSIQIFYRNNITNYNVQVLSFQITLLYDGMEIEEANTQNKLSEKQKIIIRERLMINQSLYIENIKANVNNKIVSLGTLRFICKE